MKQWLLMILLFLSPLVSAYDLKERASEKRIQDFGEKYARLYWFATDACERSPLTDKALRDLGSFRRSVKSAGGKAWSVWKKAEGAFYRDAKTWTSDRGYCKDYDQITAHGWWLLRDIAATEGDIVQEQYAFSDAYFTSHTQLSLARDVAEYYGKMDAVATSVCAAYATPKSNYLRAKLLQLKESAFRYPAETSDGWTKGEKRGRALVLKSKISPSQKKCQQLDSDLFNKLGLIMRDALMKKSIKGWWEWYGDGKPD